MERITITTKKSVTIQGDLIYTKFNLKLVIIDDHLFVTSKDNKEIKRFDLSSYLLDIHVNR